MDFAQYAADAIGSQISEHASAAALGATTYITSKMARKYLSPTTSTKSLAKRNAYKLNKLYRQVKLNTPEKHVYQSCSSLSVPTLTASAIELTAIGTGDDVSLRTGRQIRLLAVDTRLHRTNALVDCYLILAPNGTVAPVYTDFQPNQGSYTNIALKEDFKELCYYTNRNASTAFHVAHKRKLNLITKYNGATSNTGIENRLYLVFVNRTGSSQTVDYNFKLWFYAD